MEKVDRRRFLQGSLVAAAGAGLGAQPETSPAVRSGPDALRSITDTNVYLSRWPFRRIDGDETADLVELLSRRGVTQAWVGSFDGVFHKDLAAVNARLAHDCRKCDESMLLPFGSINPKLPDWELDLRRCHEEHGMPGIRLHPSYHCYTLDNPAFVRLLRMASDRGMIVQIAAWMEDERHQNPLMPVPTVDPAPLTKHLSELPDLRVVLLNSVHVPADRRLPALVEAGQVFFDLARLELIEGLAELLKRVPVERILFGSYSPMFYFESTLLKLHESVLDESQTERILKANAARLLTTSRVEAGKP